MKKITIIGSTGSIGRQTLDLVRRHPDKFSVVGLVCNSDYKLLLKQAQEFKPRFVGLTNIEASNKYREEGGEVLSPDTALVDCVTEDIDVLVVACSGINGLLPTLKAIRLGIDVALANKETLVVGGELVKEAMKTSKSRLFPVDSEHSAIWQSININKSRDISRIIITASGGAFRNYTYDMLKTAKAKDALKHPNWNMGKKITVDCATLMNKGLEIIEATHLFDVEADKVQPIIHPESIIHSMVEYNDGAIIAQLGNPSMLVPIQYALTYPERYDTGVKSVDFLTIKSLNFSEPDRERFPCLKIAEDMAREGGLARTVMNASNDVAVDLYLSDKIGFYDIPRIISEELDNFNNHHDFALSDVLECDRETRERVYLKYQE